MRSGLVIVILLIGLSVAIAGCASSRQDQPTPQQNANAQPTADTSMLGTIYNNQLRMVVFGYGANPHGYPVNYSIKMMNVGSTEINHIHVILTETDNSTDEILNVRMFDYNQSIPGRGYETFKLYGGTHSLNLTNYDLNICFYWGDHAEYWNSVDLPIDLPRDARY